MRLLNRLFVMLFVRRKAQAHARAVLDEQAKKRARKPAKRQAAGKPKAKAKPKAADSAKPDEAVAALQPDGAPADPPAVAETAAPAPPEGSVIAGRPVEPGSEREALIRAALAARKSREAEWDALTPAQKSRAVAGLGEGMAALVGTFGKSDRAA